MKCISDIIHTHMVVHIDVLLYSNIYLNTYISSLRNVMLETEVQCNMSMVIDLLIYNNFKSI